MTNTKTKPGPIEVWLRMQDNDMEIACTLVREDESTEQLDVEAMSMRGAQRELTGWVISQGYEPAGRWRVEAVSETDGKTLESMRQFRAKT